MRSRQIVAIIGACALSALAAGAAFYALSAVDRSLLYLAERELPAALAAQAIARQAQTLAAAGPALRGVASLDEHEALSGRVAEDVAALTAQIARIKGFSDPRSIRGGIEALLLRLRVNLGILEILAANRIVLGARRHDLMRRLSAAYAAAESALQPRIAALEADVFALRKQLEVPRRGQRPPTMERLSALLIGSTSLQAALAEASTVTALFVRAVDSRRAEEIEALDAPLRRALYQLEELTLLLEPEVRAIVAAQAGQFQKLFEGPESLFRLRHRELDQAVLAKRRLAENEMLARQLAEASDRLTARAAQNIEAIRREADTMFHFGAMMLALAIGFGMIGAILAARLYYGRLSSGD